MPPWLLKAAVQDAISLMPASHRLNFFFQKYVTRTISLKESWFIGKLDACARHLEYHRKYAHQDLPDSVLELGTGWQPIIPIAMYLCGVPQIYTIDISSLLYVPIFAEVIQFFVKFASSGQLTKHLPGVQTDRVHELEQALTRLNTLSIPEILKSWNIVSIIGDARQLDLQGKTVDLFISNNTLEHIPGDVIRDIFIAFRSAASANSLMSHHIDLSDHYSHFDRTITPYHFLRYSDTTWRLFNNHLQYQSRLRVSDYRQIHQQAGFTLLEEHNQQAAPEAISRIRLAPKFRHYDHEDLIVTSSWMVSKPGDSTLATQG